RYVETVTRLVDERVEARAAPGDGGAEAVVLLVHLGRALESDGYDDARAAATYRRAEQIGTLFGSADVPIRHDVWCALERVYGRLGDVAAQAEVLEKRADAMANIAAPAPERADPLYVLASIRLADAAKRVQGGDLLERAMQIDPQPERAEAILRGAAAAHAD